MEEPESIFRLLAGKNSFADGASAKHPLRLPRTFFLGPGVSVALDQRFVSIDIFTKPSCAHFCKYG